uniref:Uncharacterized protein n=1 Tax=Anguilla anguilla TaxID=7936 RepID=A0A0E9SCP0_ANGAN
MKFSLKNGVLLVETLYGLFLKAFQISALKSHFLIKRFVILPN